MGIRRLVKLWPYGMDLRRSDPPELDLFSSLSCGEEYLGTLSILVIFLIELIKAVQL